MSGIYVQKLNPKLKQNIADKVYTISEMAQIRKKVETQIATTQKGVRRAVITLLVIAVVLLCMTAAQIGTGMIFRVSVAGTACIGIIVLAAVWVAGIGLIKYQFNRAVRKAYPGHPELLL